MAPSWETQIWRLHHGQTTIHGQERERIGEETKTAPPSPCRSPACVYQYTSHTINTYILLRLIDPILALNGFPKKLKDLHASAESFLSQKKHPR